MAFSKTKRETIHKKYKCHCAYCGDPVSYKDMQIDHIIPKANFVNWITNKINIPKFLNHLTIDDMNNNDNLNPSCRVCNKFKDTFSLELFREELSKQISRTFRSSANYRRMIKYGLVKETPHKIVFFFEKKRRYVFDGEHHLLQFESEEPRWFLNWVIMRRKFKKSQVNVREVIKDVQHWRNKTYELEEIIKNLKTKNDKLSKREQKAISELEAVKNNSTKRGKKANTHRAVEKLFGKKEKKQIKRRNYKGRR